MKVKIGDKIKIVNSVMTEGQYQNGDVLTVKELCAYKCVYVEEFTRPMVDQSEYEVVKEPIKEPPMAKTVKKIRLVDGHIRLSESDEVKIGDKIRIVGAWGADGKYKNGDVLTVKTVLVQLIVLVEEFEESFICKNEYEVIKEPANVKVGDKIRIVGAIMMGDRYKNGDVLTVRKVIYQDIVFVNEFEHPCICKSEYEIVKEPVCVQKKHIYTNDEEDEANYHTKQLLADAFDQGLSITWYVYIILGTVKCKQGLGYPGKVEKEDVATCSDNDEWSEPIGRMVAISKLMDEPLPDWVLNH